MPRIALLTFFVTLAAACVPWRFSGYLPHGVGVLESGYCVAGIRDRLRIHAPLGVDVLLRASTDDQTQTILLDLSLVFPEGVSVKLLSSELVLSSAEWPEPRTLAVRMITGGAARVHEPLAVLHGSSDESESGFTLWFVPGEKGSLWRTGIRVARDFTAKIPALDINGTSFEVPPVHFETYRRWGVYTCAQ